MKIITGFNVVEDLIVELNNEILKLLIKVKPEIKDAIFNEKDIELEMNAQEKEKIKKIILPYVKERRIGGQAGIIGEELGRLGYKVEIWSNYCSLPLRYAIPKKTTKDCLDKLRQNIILEYKKNKKLLNHITLDNNRLILADRSIITLPYSEIKIKGDKGFFSGYHHITDSNQFKIVKENIPNLEGVKKRHIELAMNAHERIRKLISKEIIPTMHSIGANIYEIEAYYGVNAYDFEKIIDKVFKHEIERLHVHDREKHYVIFDNRKSDVKKELKALLKGNKAVISKAKFGYVRKNYNPRIIPRETFIQTYGDHTIIEVSLVKAENPKFTVGLGDILSAFSFVALD